MTAKKKVLIKKPKQMNWPTTTHAAPNSIIRSALFGMVEKGNRRYQKRAVIACWKGTQIRYTGEQLDQSDLDVWMNWINIGKNRIEVLPDTFLKTPYAFLKEMQRENGKSGRDWVHEVIIRLTACVIEIDDNGYKYGGSLIDEFFFNENTGHYMISINPRLRCLFEQGLTFIEPHKRKSLGNNQLAKWLMFYLHSHQAPHKISLEKLHQLCGSSSRFKQFKFNLKKLLNPPKSEYKNAQIVDNILIMGHSENQFGA